MKILYIHGFASVGNSYKGKLLVEKYGEDRVISPTFSSKPREAVNQIEKIINHKGPLIMAGTSLGGFYSDYFNAKYSIPAIVINPLVDPDGVEKYIGENRNYYTNEVFDFTRDDFEYLKKLKSEKESFSNYHNREAREIILLAEDDDLLDYKLALKEYNHQGQEVRVFPEGGHRFTNSYEILRAVRDIISWEE